MYTVVYEGLGGVNSMPLGTRCIVDYKSEEDFESYNDGKSTVVGKGVSKEEAKRLLHEVSGKTLARAALERGLNEPGSMQMHIFNFRLAAASSGKVREFNIELLNIVGCAALISEDLKTLVG